MSTTPTAPEAVVEDPGHVTGRLDGVSRARVVAVLVVIVLFTEVTPLQYTMVAAALQKIAPSFPGEGANINWALIVFSLVGGAAAPLIGKVSDIWGKKRTFLLCGLFFLVGCIIDAVTHDWALFLIGRGFQALAVATQLVAYGLIRDLLPRTWVPVGLGVTATGLGFSALVAPIIGGWLLDNHSYHAIFWFLAIFVLVMTPLVIFIVPESKLRVRERIDFVGAVLLAAGVTLTLIYLDKGQDWGWGKFGTLVWLIGGLLLLVAFVAVETRVKTPIMDVKLLFHPRVSMVLLMSFFASAMIGIQPYAMGYMTETPNEAAVKALGIQQAVTQASQQYHITLPASAFHIDYQPGYSYGNGFSLLQYAWHIALASSVAAMICGAVAGILSRRIGPRLPVLAALVAFVAVGVCYALMPFNWVGFLIVGTVFGAAFGIYYASQPILIVEAVPQEQQGISVGMAGVVGSMGTAVGLAVVTAFLNAHPIYVNVTLNGNKVAHQIAPDLFADRGYILGFWFAAAGSLIALIVALFMRHGRQPATGGTAH